MHQNNTEPGTTLLYRILYKTSYSVLYSILLNTLNSALYTKMFSSLNNTLNIALYNTLYKTLYNTLYKTLVVTGYGQLLFHCKLFLCHPPVHLWGAGARSPTCSSELPEMEFWTSRNAVTTFRRHLGPLVPVKKNMNTNNPFSRHEIALLVLLLLCLFRTCKLIIGKLWTLKLFMSGTLWTWYFFLDSGT